MLEPENVSSSLNATNLLCNIRTFMSSGSDSRKKDLFF